MAQAPPVWRTGTGVPLGGVGCCIETSLRLDSLSRRSPQAGTLAADESNELSRSFSQRRMMPATWWRSCCSTGPGRRWAVLTSSCCTRRRSSRRKRREPSLGESPS